MNVSIDFPPNRGIKHEKKEDKISNLNELLNLVNHKKIGIEKVSKLILDWVDSQENVESNFLNLKLFNEILHKVVGEENTLKLSPEYTGARKEFVLNLIKFCQEKISADDSIEKKEVNKFITKFSRIFLSSSDNVLDYLGSVDNNLEILAKLRSIPELEHFYADKMFGVVYTLNFDVDKETLIKFINKTEIDEKLSVIRTFVDITRTGIGQGYAENLFHLLNETLKESKGESVLLDAIIDISIYEINNMVYNDMPINHNQQTATFQKETLGLTSKVIIPEQYHNFYSFHIAKNMIALRDRYGAVRYISKIESSDFKKSTLTHDQLIFYNLKEVLDNRNRYSDFDIKEYLKQLQDKELEKQAIETLENNTVDQFIDDILQPVFSKIAEAKEINLENIQSIDKVLENKDNTILIQEMHEPGVRDIIEQQIGTDLENLSFKSQEFLLKYLLETNGDDFRKVREVSYSLKHEDRTAFLTSFLSIQHGGKEMGQKILSIGENYPSEVANTIFKKYTELVEATDEIESYLLEQFGKKDPKLVREISEGLLIRGKELLEEFADEQKGDIEKLLFELESIKANNYLLVEEFKAFKKAGLIQNIEDLKNITSGELSNAEILNNTEIIETIERIYKRNYSDYSEDGLNSLMDNFRERLFNVNTKVFVLKDHNEIIAFALATENPEKKEVYLSALNVNPSTKGTAAGRVVLENTLNRYKQKGFLMKAEATPDNSQYYLNEYNFFAYERVEDPDEDYILNLARNDKITFISKNKEKYTKEKIKEMAISGAIADNNIAVWMSLDSNLTPPELEQGYVITQMFRGSNENEIGNYFLLEKIKN